MSPRSEVRGLKSEVRYPRSEVRGLKSEVRCPRSEVRGLKSEVRYPRYEVIKNRDLVFDIPVDAAGRADLHLWRFKAPRQKYRMPRVARFQGPGGSTFAITFVEEGESPCLLRTPGCQEPWKTP